MEWKVGFVGYSGKKFDVEEGKKIVANIMKVCFIQWKCLLPRILIAKEMAEMLSLYQDTRVVCNAIENTNYKHWEYLYSFMKRL